VAFNEKHDEPLAKVPQAPFRQGFGAGIQALMFLDLGWKHAGVTESETLARGRIYLAHQVERKGIFVPLRGSRSRTKGGRCGPEPFWRLLPGLCGLNFGLAAMLLAGSTRE